MKLFRNESATMTDAECRVSIARVYCDCLEWKERQKCVNARAGHSVAFFYNHAKVSWNFLVSNTSF